ncbi:hypothetical protein TWF506_010306 [Arthrobotrys conoides]|uniref:Uncharacterized protein n=1 Tax=Arthrobotrys conoides TaxID=74498 RepID=A0AAN8NR79_9PEZI
MPKAPRLRFDDTQVCLEAALAWYPYGRKVKNGMVSTTQLAFSFKRVLRHQVSWEVSVLVLGDTMSDGARLRPKRSPPGLTDRHPTQHLTKQYIFSISQVSYSNSIISIDISIKFLVDEFVWFCPIPSL